MAKFSKNILYLILASALVAGAVVMMIIATVNSSKYGKLDYSHDLKIKEVKSDLEPAENGILHHYAVLQGGITNNTDEEFKLLSVEILLAGVNNKTGEYTEFATSFVIESLGADATISLTDESLKVGNRSGFMPESIKQVRILVNGEFTPIEFEENTDSNLILFAVSLAFVFVAGLLFAKWSNTNKIKETKGETKEESKI